MDLYNIEVNVITGEVTKIPFTAEEIAAYEAANLKQPISEQQVL